MSYTPGFGDAATWGPCTGHPADPRTSEGEELMDGLQEAISYAQGDLSKAAKAETFEEAAMEAQSAVGWILEQIDPLPVASEIVWELDAKQIGKLLVTVISSLRGEDDFYKDDNSLVIRSLQAASQALIDGVKQ